MEQLFTREGELYEQEPEFNEAGKAVYTRYTQCDRCCVVNGVRLWVRWIENGKARSNTGFDCWTCNNTGIKSSSNHRLYTAKELEKVLKTAETVKARKERAYAERKARSDEKRARRLAVYCLENSEFLNSLKSLLSGDESNYWDRMYAGFMYHMDQPTDKVLNQVREEVAKRALNTQSQYIGNIGDAVIMRVTVERVITMFSHLYGNTYLNICRDENNNVVVYKGKADIGIPGEVNIIKATVKDHQLYNDVQQTVIERPKLVK
jgi:hypothetical protein